MKLHFKDLDSKPLADFQGRFDWTYPLQTPRRLDHLLASITRSVSRAFWVRALASGLIFVNQKIVTRKGLKVEFGDRIQFDYYRIVRQLEGRELSRRIPYRSIHEDENFVVAEKPGGELIHRIGFLDYSVVSQMSLDIGQELHVIHRLDKHTSGLVVFARHAEAARRFQNLLHSGRMHKLYLAASYHRLRPSSGLMEEAIGQDDPRIHSKKQKVCEETGLFCKTRYRWIGKLYGYQYYLVRIFTGRQHQIRVHFQHRGAHLIQDELYSYSDYDILPDGYDYDESQLGLHAFRMRFEDPFSGQDRVFSSYPKRWPFLRVENESI